MHDGSLVLPFLLVLQSDVGADKRAQVGAIQSSLQLQTKTVIGLGFRCVLLTQQGSLAQDDGFGEPVAHAMAREGSVLLIGWMHPWPACRCTNWLCTGIPYSQEKNKYTSFFSALLPQGKVLCTQTWDIFAMLLSHLQRCFFLSVTTPLQPPSLNQLFSPRCRRGPRVLEDIK